MLTNQIQIYQYNGSPVTFQKGDSVMVNATEMAKPFGKRSADFLTLKSTKELIHSLSAKTGIPVTALILVNQGGNNQGTWMHEDLALIFAQWLSPQFYLWCNDHIKELLTTGVTTSSDDDAAIAHAMEILNKRLEQAKAEKERLQLENKEQQAQIQANAPRVLFSQAVETADKSILIGELAKILKQNGIEIGERRLFKWLREKGYLCSHGERYNQPTQRAMEMGLFELKKTTINKPNGAVLVTTTTKVTGKGQIYFVNKFLRQAV